MKIPVKVSHLIKIVLTFLFAWYSLTVFSQQTNTCAENLKSAQDLFDKGQVEQVPGILYECMKSGFTKEEQLTAYKLLIQSYLFEDKLSEADSTMMEFLKKNPEYTLSPTDHISFVNLFNEFTVKPIVQVTFHLGTNIPFLTFIDRKSDIGEQGSDKYSVPLFNIFGSLEAKFKITQKIEINLEPGLSQMKFINTRGILTIGTTSYTEKQLRIEIPLSATYNFKNFGKFTLYGRLGAGPALTLSSTATVEHTPLDANGTVMPGTDISRKNSRIKMDIFVQGGAGIKYKTNGGYFFSELRANIGVYDQVVNDGFSAEEQELEHYYYTDDDFNLNAVNFTLGYTQIFYKPSKNK